MYSKNSSFCLKSAYPPSDLRAWLHLLEHNFVLLEVQLICEQWVRHNTDHGKKPWEEQKMKSILPRSVVVLFVLAALAIGTLAVSAATVLGAAVEEHGRSQEQAYKELIGRR
jgi:hypothetical protein